MTEDTYLSLWLLGGVAVGIVWLYVIWPLLTWILERTGKWTN